MPAAEDGGHKSIGAQITEFRRRGRVINLESGFWRAVFALWVAAAPVRPAMKRLCGAVSKII